MSRWTIAREGPGPVPRPPSLVGVAAPALVAATRITGPGAVAAVVLVLVALLLFLVLLLGRGSGLGGRLGGLHAGARRDTAEDVGGADREPDVLVDGAARDLVGRRGRQVRHGGVHRVEVAADVDAEARLDRGRDVVAEHGVGVDARHREVREEPGARDLSALVEDVAIGGAEARRDAARELEAHVRARAEVVIDRVGDAEHRAIVHRRRTVTEREGVLAAADEQGDLVPPRERQATANRAVVVVDDRVERRPVDERAGGVRRHARRDAEDLLDVQLDADVGGEAARREGHREEDDVRDDGGPERELVAAERAVEVLIVGEAAREAPHADADVERARADGAPLGGRALFLLGDGLLGRGAARRGGGRRLLGRGGLRARRGRRLRGRAVVTAGGGVVRLLGLGRRRLRLLGARGRATPIDGGAQPAREPVAHVGRDLVRVGAAERALAAHGAVGAVADRELRLLLGDLARDERRDRELLGDGLEAVVRVELHARAAGRAVDLPRADDLVAVALEDLHHGLADDALLRAVELRHAH